MGAPEDKSAVNKKKPKELEMPSVVTLPWLFKHVSAKQWFGAVAAALVALTAVFFFGVKASQWSFVQEMLGLNQEPQEVTEQESTKSEIEKAPVIVDTSFRDGLLTFVNARAIPAFDDMQNTLQQISRSEQEEFINTLLNNHILVEGQRLRNEMFKVFKSEEASNDKIESAVCEFFANYQEHVRWSSKIGRRNGYDFQSNEYRSWLRKDRLFDGDFDVLVADPQYEGLGRCNSFNQRERVD